jgi:hypothetical protein
MSNPYGQVNISSAPSYIATSQVQLPVGRVYELWTNSRGPKGDSYHQILGISHFPQFQMTSKDGPIKCGGPMLKNTMKCHISVVMTQEPK